MSSDRPHGFLGLAVDEITNSTGDLAYGPRPKPTETPKPEVLKEKRRTGSTPEKEKNVEPVLRLVACNQIQPWKFANRPLSEFGDMQELIHSLRLNGQEVPVLVRPAKTGYELIYGRRRWQACSDLGIKLLCLVKHVTDQEAFIAQALENEKRKDLSGYARARDYENALNNDLFKSQAALAANLGLDKSTISSIMHFTRIPADLVEAIGDMSHVGIKTAKAITGLLQDKPGLLSDLIAHADQIRDGKLAESGIKRLSKAGTEKNRKSTTVTETRYACGGKNVFSVKQTAKGEVVITILDAGKLIMDGDDTVLEIHGIFERLSLEKTQRSGKV